jgi:hypothetical protein
MAGCLLCEGALLAFMGFPYWVPIRGRIFVIGCLWVVTCIATVYTGIATVYAAIQARLIFVLTASGLLFLVSALAKPDPPEQETLMWFLYNHCLELGVIISSLVLSFISRKQRRRRAGDAV